MSNPFKKLSTVKKYLTESVLGPPGSDNSNNPDNDFQPNSAKSSSTHPNDFSRTQSFSGVPENKKNPFERQTTTPVSSNPAQEGTQSNNQSPPIVNKKADGGKHDMLKFIKGDYFEGGKSSKEFKSFAFPSGSQSEAKKEESIMRSNSMRDFEPEAIIQTGRFRRRIQDVEIEVKEVDPQTDTGRIFDSIFHHSEISSRPGAKKIHRVLINSYLDMKLKSDDISHYLQGGRPRVHTEIFGGKPMEQDKIIEIKVQSAKLKPKRKDTAENDTLDMVENYVSDDEDKPRIEQPGRRIEERKYEEPKPEKAEAEKEELIQFYDSIEPMAADVQVHIESNEEELRGFLESTDKRKKAHRNKAKSAAVKKLKRKMAKVIDPVPVQEEKEVIVEEKKEEIKEVAQEQEEQKENKDEQVEKVDSLEIEPSIKKSEEGVVQQSSEIVKEPEVVKENTEKIEKGEEPKDEKLNSQPSKSPTKSPDNAEKLQISFNDSDDYQEGNSLEIETDNFDAPATENKAEPENKPPEPKAPSEKEVQEESKTEVEPEPKTQEETQEQIQEPQVDQTPTVTQVKHSEPPSSGINFDEVIENLRKPKSEGNSRKMSLSDSVTEAKSEQGGRRSKPASRNKSPVKSPVRVKPESEIDSEVELDEDSESLSESSSSSSSSKSSKSNDSSRRGSLLETKSTKSTKENESIKHKKQGKTGSTKNLEEKEEMDVSPLLKEGAMSPMNYSPVKYNEADYFQDGEFSMSGLAQRINFEDVEAEKMEDMLRPRVSASSETMGEHVDIPKDPLDFFESVKEEEEEEKSNGIGNLEEYMVVTRNFVTNPYKLDTTSIAPCRGISEYMNPTDKKTKKYEVTVVKFAPPEFIFVGTTASTILIFDLNENLKQTLKPHEGPQQAVTALDFRIEDTASPALVVGFSGGHLIVYELKNFTVIKAITSVQTGKITSVKVLKNDPVQFVAGDETGQLVRYRVQKSLWKYNQDHKFFLTNDTTTFDIQTMPKGVRARTASSLSEEEELRFILGLAKYEKVIVMDGREAVVTADSAKILYTFERPEYVDEQCLPTLSWGSAYYQKIGKKAFLAIGWGTVIHLVQFVIQDFKPMLSYVGHLALGQAGIRYIGWLNESMLSVVDTEEKLSFVNSEEFNEGKYKISNAVVDNENSKINSYQIEDKLKSKLSFLSAKKALRTFWGSSVSASWISHEILLLGEKAIYKVGSFGALDYLDNLCQSEDWLRFLTVSLQIYKTNNQKFRLPFDINRRRDVLVPFFKEKVSGLVQRKFEKKEETLDEKKEFILALINFFTEIDFTEFLFVVCQKKAIECGLEELFFECIEPYLVSEKVNYIPNEQLEAIVSRFCKQGKKKMVYNLLENLDFSKQDKHLLLNICLENKFFELFLDVCSKVKDVTPLIRLLKDYDAAKAEGHQDKAMTYGYRCLWYIKLCINNRLSQNQQDKEQKYEDWKNIIFQLMAIIFEPKNLKTLFEIDGELTICFILLFFIGDLAKIVEERYGDYVIGHVNSNDLITDDIHSQVYQALLAGTSFWETDTDKNRYMQYLGFFHGKVAQLLRYAFLDRAMCVDFVKKYINEPKLINDRLLLLWEKMRLESEEKGSEEIKEYFKEQVTTGFVTGQRISIMLDLLKYCQFTLTVPEIDELILKARDANLIEIECMLLTMKHEYETCLEAYLSPRSSLEFRDKVFGWISETINSYYERSERSDVEKRGIEALKLAIIEKMTLLLSMDPEKTEKLIDNFLHDKMGRVVRKLKSEHSLQLKVLEKYIAKIDENTRIDLELLVLHIHLLARSNRKAQKRIRGILKKSNRYPLDACLDIVKANNINDALAYLEMKQGNVLTALEISIKIVEETLKKYFEKENFKYVEKEGKIFSKIGDLLEYLGQVDRNAEGLWFDTLVNLYILIDDAQQGQEEERRDEFEALKQDIVNHMLENIAGSFGTKDILKILNTQNEKIPERLKSKILTKIILNNAHENFILEYCQDLAQNDLYLFNSLHLFPKSITGTSHFPTCQTCDKSFLSHDHILWFGCGHLFHASESCCPQGKCPFCKSSVHSLVTRFTLARMATYLRSPHLQINRENARENRNDQKVEKLVRSTKDVKAENHKDKIIKFQQFAKRKTKANKEFADVVDKGDILNKRYNKNMYILFENGKKNVVIE